MSFSREELASAFEHYLAEVNEAIRTRDWWHYANLYAPDATYKEHAYGEFNGRQEIYDWIQRTMTTFPGSQMTGFPSRWTSIDVEKGWVICEFDNVMRDVGDGRHHGETNVSILTHAGDNLWARQEDVYNPMHFATMIGRWLKAAHRVGELDHEARA